MSLTPLLCAMLNDELLRERDLVYLNRAQSRSRSARSTGPSPSEIKRSGSDRPFRFSNAAKSTSIGSTATW